MSAATATHELSTARRIDAIGWALFFIMIGGLWLVPEEIVFEGAWLIGVGLIMLGNNVARLLTGLRTVGFTLFLGALALGTGLCDLANVDLPVFPILIILVGASIVIRTLKGGAR